MKGIDMANTKNDEEYEYLCSACNSNVDATDKVCSNCGISLEDEINRTEEFEEILRAGTDKSYTAFCILSDRGEKEKTKILG